MVAAGIDHPNVIPIYDAGEVDGLLYIATRYVEGLSAAFRIVIDTDRTNVPVMGLQREPDRVGPSARDPSPDGVSLVPRGDATGASGASEPAHGAGRS
jgi:hypothetical protein